MLKPNSPIRGLTFLPVIVAGVVLASCEVKIRVHAPSQADSEPVATVLAPPAYVGESSATMMDDARTITMQIDGMTCIHCSASVEEVLGAVPGVRAVQISYESGKATLRCDPAVAVNTDELAKAVTALGFEVKSVD